MYLFKFLLILSSLLSFQVCADDATLQVDVNTATAQEIQEVLSGVGEKKAQAIVDYRNAHGLFVSPYDLTLVNGIGKKTVEKNVDKMMFSSPEPVSTPTETAPSQPEETAKISEPTEMQQPATESINNRQQPTEEANTPQNIEPDFTDAQITPESLKFEPAQTN